MSIYQKLLNIQTEVNCPKNLYNSFGNYYYRNAEAILEALKPLLIKHNATLTLTDEVVEIGSRLYVKATACLMDVETEAKIVTAAFAREEENKKGMDGAQITGSASSYARKYALNGLFCLDDVKDSDATNKHGKDDVPKKDNGKQGHEKAQKALFATVKEAGFSKESVKSWLEGEYGVAPTNELTEQQLKDFRQFILDKVKEIEFIAQGSES